MSVDVVFVKFLSVVVVAFSVYLYVGVDVKFLGGGYKLFLVLSMLLFDDLCVNVNDVVDVGVVEMS